MEIKSILLNIKQKNKIINNLMNEENDSESEKLDKKKKPKIKRVKNNSLNKFFIFIVNKLL